MSADPSTITEEQLTALREAAANARDFEMVDLCDEALNSQDIPWPDLTDSERAAWDAVADALSAGDDG